MTWKDLAPALKSLVKKLGLTPENPYSDKPTLFGPSNYRPRSYKGPSEGTLHELGHVIILGLLFTNKRGPRMKDDATEQIDEILGKRDAKTSDDHEIYVLATEKRFADKMGLKLGVSSLVGYAFMGFRYYTETPHYQPVVERVKKLSTRSKVIARHTRRLMRIVKSEMVEVNSKQPRKAR